MTPATNVQFRQPEPGLRPQDLVRRASDLRQQLLDEQEGTEDRGTYSPEMDETFKRSGFYRTLLPRRFGGYEFDVPTFLRMIVEVSRGCPSTGWCLCLAAGHALQLGGLFSEDAQIEALSPDGEFAAPMRALPMGTATPVADGWRVEGTWDYCSGSPYSTHALLSVRLPGDGDPMFGLVLVPRADWVLLDDWRQRAFGMRGSGSNSIRVDGAVIPDHFLVRSNLLNTDFSGDSVGYRLHGNPMYAGHPLGYLQLEITAVLVGCGHAAVDEYERIIRAKKTTGPNPVARYTVADYQRNLGLAIGKLDAADDVLVRSSNRYMQYCAEATTNGAGFSGERLLRIHSATHQAINHVWEAVELLFRTSGTSEGGRNGTRMQRYYRDLSMARTNIGLQYESFAELVAKVHLGLETAGIR